MRSDGLRPDIRHTAFTAVQPHKNRFRVDVDVSRMKSRRCCLATIARGPLTSCSLSPPGVPRSEKLRTCTLKIFGRCGCMYTHRENIINHVIGVGPRPFLPETDSSTSTTLGSQTAGSDEQRNLHVQPWIVAKHTCRVRGFEKLGHCC